MLDSNKQKKKNIKKMGMSNGSLLGNPFFFSVCYYAQHEIKRRFYIFQHNKMENGYKIQEKSYLEIWK